MIYVNEGKENRIMKRTDENDRLESIISEIKQTDTQTGLISIAAQLFNSIMEKEREISLREQMENKANGYYNRQLASSLGNLGISVPRDRKGLFRSFFLPDHWQRSDPSYQDLIVNLVMQSYSPNKIKALLTDLSLPYSPEQIEEIREELYTKAKELKTRQLPDNAICLFIDAYHTDIKDEETSKVRKAVIYSIIGINMDGTKEVYSYYVFYDSETKEDWLCIFNDLILRGLKRVLLVISDDFSGLADAIKTLFPKADHQLCFIHMQRNVRRNMAKSDAKTFNDELSMIRKLKDFEQALSKFSALCEQFKNKYPHFIKHLLSRKELYFSFLKFPETVRKHIYTTNAVESLNSRLEVLRINSGGYFQSMKTVDAAVYVMIQKLVKRKWKKPIPAFCEAKYEIHQLFNCKFNSEKN